MLPTVNPVAVITCDAPDIKLQNKLVRLLQLPDSNCSLGLVKLAPMLLIVMVVFALVAVKRYQTSYRGKPHSMSGSAVYVEPPTEPEMVLHVFPGLITAAVAHVLPWANEEKDMQYPMNTIRIRVKVGFMRIRN